MAKKAIQTILALGLILLSACNSEDALVGGDGSTTGGQTSAASLTLLTSSTQVGSSGSSSIDLTAIAKDGNNNLLADVPVTFTSSSGALEVSQGTTDASGQALATLGPGGDYSNRTITVTAAVGNLSETVSVSVTGTTLSISGEGSATIGDAAALTIDLRDSDNNPIANREIVVTSALSNPVNATTLTTNSAGQVLLSVTAANSGTDTVTASAEGASASHTLFISSDQFQLTAPALNAVIDIGDCRIVTASWKQSNTPVTGQTINFSATRGALYSDSGCGSAAPSAVTNGSGIATLYIKSANAGPSTLTATAVVDGGPSTSRSISFVATDPASIDLQASPSTIGPNDGSQTQQQQSTITAVVRDSANNLVANKVVQFSIVQDNSGGTLTSSTATTNSLGRASTSYISSAATTAQNGVQIKAAIEDDTSINKTVSLTVSQSALFVRLGTGNLISSVGQTLYDKKYTVIVTDASGNAASGKNVTLAVTSVAYTKGTYVYDDDASRWVQVSSDGTAATGEDPQSEANLCPSEDDNRNGILDSGEDDNGNGQLTPGNIASVPTSVTTGSDGTFEFSVIYAKQYANWVRVELTATTSVAGTESSDLVTFWLPIASTDVTSQQNPPPGLPSPFGLVTGVCTNTN